MSVNIIKNITLKGYCGMKLTRKKNKRRNIDGTLIHPFKVKRICKGWSNKGMLGRR